MTKPLILDRKSKVLRQVARPVDLKIIGTKKLGDILSKMKKALHAENDGVAIAAPQIGVSLRIFMVKGGVTSPKSTDKVFINPEVLKLSKKRVKVEEGCLSVRYLYGQVSRHEKMTIKALDKKGKVMTIGASRLLAQIFQHEIDHLNGILFIDKAENVRDLPPEPKNGKN